MGKRGLSTVVATILIVLLVIIAVAGLGVMINNFLIKGSAGITLGDIGLDIEIKNVIINETTGIVNVKVERNPGISKAEIKALKVIIEDENNAEVFDIPVENFDELAIRTLNINVTTNGIINISGIIKVSVAPIYISDTTGEDALSPITSAYTVEEIQHKIITEIKVCFINSDCGIDYWLLGSQICNVGNTGVLQYKRIYECFGAADNTGGFCQQKTEAIPVETCTEGKICSGGACKLPTISCTPENVTEACGVSKLIGIPKCSSDNPSTRIIQDFDQLSCVNNICEESITSTTLEECISPKVCSANQGSPECFTPLECTTNEDCPLGEVCKDGNCTTEEVILNGTISSIWPFSLGEYFDSPALPNSSTGQRSYLNLYIIFPGSNEVRCLKILKYVYPNSTLDNSYVQLDKKETEIKSGNKFEIWETAYACTLI